MEPQGDALPDWAYPSEESVPESLLHLRIRTMLYTLVQRYLAQQGVEALTGSDQFVYWVEGNPRLAVAPDVYVVLDRATNYDVPSWMTWREGKAPELAVEIVSDDLSKDYRLAPRRYAEVGVQELIIFDPAAGPSRHRWQVYRRDDRGELVHALTSQHDRVPSQVLGCFLRCVGDGEHQRVRLAVDPRGDTLLPSAEEGEAAERAAKEQERNRREALEAEVAALKAELARHRED